MGHLLDLARARAVPSASASNSAGSNGKQRNVTPLLPENRGAEGRYRWRVTRPKDPPFEVCVVPELTAEEVLARYPGAMIELLDDHNPEFVDKYARAREERADSLADDPGMEARRQRVLEILEANPGFRYAVITDSDSEPGAVVVHIGIRGIASGEIVIAKASYDGIVLLKALEAAT